MKTARLIFSILGFVGFLFFVGFLLLRQRNLKEEAFGAGFNGMVISTLKEKRGGSITIEIMENDLKCFVRISRIEAGELFPQYGDSIFKRSNSDAIFLKKDQSVDAEVLNGVSCLSIDCPVKKISDR